MCIMVESSEELVLTMKYGAYSCKIETMCTHDLYVRSWERCEIVFCMTRGQIQGHNIVTERFFFHHTNHPFAGEHVLASFRGACLCSFGSRSL